MLAVTRTSRALLALASLATLAAGGCAIERPIDLAVISPTGAVGHEIRVRAVDASFVCPTVSDPTWRSLASGPDDRVFEYGVDLPAQPIGELPRGRYAFVYLGRDARCDALYFGCEAAEVGPAGPRRIEISVEPLTDAERSVVACAADACDRGFCR